MKPASGILVSIVLLILGLPAAADDLIISRAVLEDRSGTLSIADVAGRINAPAGPGTLFSPGSTNAAYWVRLRVRPPGSGNKVVLFIRPTYLNEVRLYEAGPGDPLTWKTRVTGNLHPYAQRDRASISLGFVVDVSAPETTYYLRVKTRTAPQLNVEALTPEEAERKDHNRDLVMVFFVTSMTALLFWALFSYLLDRQRVVALFALHQAVYTLFGIIATGYLAPLAPAAVPRLLDWANALLYFGINYTAVFFVRELFRTYDPPPALMRGLGVLMWTAPILLAAIVLGYDNLALNANSVLIKIAWVYFVVMAFTLRAENSPSRRVLQVFFVAVLLSNVAFWSASRSERFASVINVSGMQLLIVDGLIIGGLFAMMLHARARRARRKAQQAALDLLLVQRNFEIEQELKMLAEVRAQTDYLTGVFNRRHFVELAERELARSIRFHRPFTMLMIDIDHFKSVNDTWGHSTGDAVLKEVSRVIRDAVRDEDIFGRTGGEEFTAVFVETEGNDAVEIAQRLCTTVENGTFVATGGERVKVTISAGLTELRGRTMSFEGILKEADAALYKAKHTGRNRVVVSQGS